MSCFPEDTGIPRLLGLRKTDTVRNTIVPRAEGGKRERRQSGMAEDQSQTIKGDKGQLDDNYRQLGRGIRAGEVLITRAF